MKHILKLILAAIIMLSATPAPAMDNREKAGMEEVKKKKKKKKKKKEVEVPNENRVFVCVGRLRK